MRPSNDNVDLPTEPISDWCPHRLDDALDHLLGVAEQHHGVVAVEQRVVDASVA